MKSFLPFAHYGVLFFMHINENNNIIRRILTGISVCLPAFFWTLLIFSFDTPDIAVLTLLCAAIHELGHEVYIYLKLGKLKLPSAELHGMKISGSVMLRFSYREEAMLYASGPLANIVTSLLTLPLIPLEKEYLLCFFAVNLTTALSNLIPIRGYDGYGILSSIMRHSLCEERALRILNHTSLTFTVALCLISLYFVDRLGESYWICAVFTFSLLSEISRGLKKIKYEKN